MPPAFAVSIFEYSVNSIKKSLTTRHRISEQGI